MWNSAKTTGCALETAFAGAAVQPQGQTAPMPPAPAGPSLAGGWTTGPPTCLDLTLGPSLVPGYSGTAPEGWSQAWGRTPQPFGPTVSAAAAQVPPGDYAGVLTDPYTGVRYAAYTRAMPEPIIPRGGDMSLPTPAARGADGAAAALALEAMTGNSALTAKPCRQEMTRDWADALEGARIPTALLQQTVNAAVAGAAARDTYFTNREVEKPLPDTQWAGYIGTSYVLRVREDTQTVQSYDGGGTDRLPDRRPAADLSLPVPMPADPTGLGGPMAPLRRILAADKTTQPGRPIADDVDHYGARLQAAQDGMAAATMAYTPRPGGVLQQVEGLAQAGAGGGLLPPQASQDRGHDGVLGALTALASMQQLGVGQTWGGPAPPPQASGDRLRADAMGNPAAPVRAEVTTAAGAPIVGAAPGGPAPATDGRAAGRVGGGDFVNPAPASLSWTPHAHAAAQSLTPAAGGAAAVWQPGPLAVAAPAVASATGVAPGASPAPPCLGGNPSGAWQGALGAGAATGVALEGLRLAPPATMPAAAPGGAGRLDEGLAPGAAHPVAPDLTGYQGPGGGTAQQLLAPATDRVTARTDNPLSVSPAGLQLQLGALAPGPGQGTGQHLAGTQYALQAEEATGQPGAGTRVDTSLPYGVASGQVLGAGAFGGLVRPGTDQPGVGTQVSLALQAQHQQQQASAQSLGGTQHALRASGDSGPGAGTRTGVSPPTAAWAPGALPVVAIAADGGFRGGRQLAAAGAGGTRVNVELGAANGAADAAAAYATLGPAEFQQRAVLQLAGAGTRVGVHQQGGTEAMVPAGLQAAYTGLTPGTGGTTALRQGPVVPGAAAAWGGVGAYTGLAATEATGLRAAGTAPGATVRVAQPSYGSFDSKQGGAAPWGTTWDGSRAARTLGDAPGAALRTGTVQLGDATPSSGTSAYATLAAGDGARTARTFLGPGAGTRVGATDMHGAAVTSGAGMATVTEGTRAARTYIGLGATTDAARSRTLFWADGPQGYAALAAHPAKDRGDTSNNTADKVLQHTALLREVLLSAHPATGPTVNATYLPPAETATAALGTSATCLREHNASMQSQLLNAAIWQQQALGAALSQQPQLPLCDTGYESDY